MATQGQYQSFALIAYSAIKEQMLYVNAQIANGCKDDNCAKILYLSKNINDVVFNYSMGCRGTNDMLESDILAMCNWLMRMLNFTTSVPISQLDETYLNISNGSDFNFNDFNPNDFN